jgi:hypothetical protein
METHDHLATRQLSLVDESGRVRVSMRMEDGGPTIRLLDRDGTPRLAVALADGGPVIGLQDAAGKPRMTLILHPNEDGSIMWQDRHGQLRLNLTGDTVHPRQPMLTQVVRDPGGAIEGVVAFAIRDGSPGITMLGPDGRIIS